MLVVLLLIAATGAAVIFFGKEIGLNIPLSNVAPPAPKISAPHKPATQPDWQKEAYQVLHNYLAAATSQEKLPFILNAESLASRLQEFYRSDALKDRDTPAEAFSVSPLTEEDYKRGIYMLVFNQSQQEPVRVFAFFKRTPEGLKLDWETFAQTKYRTFHTFIESPKEGATGVFRVLMVDDTLDTDQAASEIRTYRIVDPAHTGDTTKIDVPLDSEIGRTLSAVNWRGSKEGRPAPRTATIELRWSGDSQAPKLEISRFICWEFLGLGGQESSSVTQ